MTLLDQLPPARSMSTKRYNAASRQLADVVEHTTQPWWRFSRSTTIALVVGFMLTGSAAAGVLIPTEEEPNPAVASAALTMSSTLAKQYPFEFAGITLSNDNATINVYVTGISSSLRNSVLDQVPSTATVKFITVANTWNALLAIQGQLESELSALRAEGIDVVGFSTDPTTNREVIDVVNLNSSQAATLDQQFGAQFISVQGISADQAPTPLASNW
jgi:hypothetical protein